MNFSTELDIWLIFCSVGLVAKVWLVCKTAARVRAAIALREDRQFIDATRQLLSNQWMRLGFWIIYLGIGLVSLVQPRPTNPLPPTPGTILIQWGLISGVVLLALQTINDVVHTIHQEHLAVQKLNSRRVRR